MNRGDVYRHKFKEPDKTRPVLILTRNEAIPKLNAITVIPITTTIQDILSQVVLTEYDGMEAVCVLSSDWIQTVPKNKLSSYITHLSDERRQEVFEAIKFAFGFDK